jgi:hypothetical protein
MSKELKGKFLITKGASIAGGTASSAVGAIIGGLIAGPEGSVAGAAAGGAIGETLKVSIEEFASRALSDREQTRVGAVIDYAAFTIQERLERGDKPRDDGFFDFDETQRSEAVELFEGVLLRAKNENQEKKLPYLGKLFANTAFRPDIPPSLAAFLLKAAEDLSYQQFCYLSLAGKESSLYVKDLRKKTHPVPDLQALKKEEMSLHSPSAFGGYGFLTGKGGWDDELSPIGQVLYEILELSQIPDEDLNAIRRKLELCQNSPEPPEL